MNRLIRSDSMMRLEQDTQIAPRGFRYGFASGIFHEAVYDELIKTFPPAEEFRFVDKPSGGGQKRFYVGPKYYSGLDRGCICHLSHIAEIWKNVLRELASPEFIGLFGRSTRIGFNSLCQFGFTYGKEGCVQEPHIDGAVRPDDSSPIHPTIACLFYFNQEPGGVGGTQVYENDRQTILFEVPDLRNSMFFFEQHIDAWHGFPPLPPGAERRLVSVSFSMEERLIEIQTSPLHKLFCGRYIKKIFAT